MAASTKAEAATSPQLQLSRDERRCWRVVVPNVRPRICSGAGRGVAQLTATITAAETIVISTLKY